MRDRKWIGRDRVRCIVLKEKGSKAEEKIHDFVMRSGLNRVVLIISYEVNLDIFLLIEDVSQICRCDQWQQSRSFSL